MDHPSIRGSYFSEFISELTSIEISKERFGVHGEEYDYNIIRAHRYTQYREDVDAYEHYIARLATQTIAEACLFTKDQAATVSKFLHQIYLMHLESFQILEAHKALFEKHKFNSAQFEKEFFPNFNIPRRITFSDGHPDFGDLRTTKHFWSDLYDALMYKHESWKLVFSRINGLFDITLPENSSEYSLVSMSSPNASEVRFHIQENKIEPLFLVLRDFFDTKDHEFLRALLCGEKIERQLQFKGSAKDISESFFYLHRNGVINGPEGDMIAWLSNNFYYYRKDQFHPLIMATILTYKKNPITTPPILLLTKLVQ